MNSLPSNRAFTDKILFIFIYIDLLPHVNDKEITEDFINCVVKKLVEYIDTSNDRNTKVINFISPEDITKEINFELNDDRESLDGVLNHVDSILKYVVKTGKHLLCDSIINSLSS